MISNHPMQQFHDMLQRIQEHGSFKGNRTGVYARFLPNQMVTFDLADGFPAITTKKLAFKSARGEMLGFWRGYTNSQQFADIGCPVWHQNANETPAWLASPFRKGTGDIGRAYSKQFTDFKYWFSTEIQNEAELMLLKGYKLIAHDKVRNVWVLQKSVNQLEECLHTLMTNPNDRRMIVSAWKPDEFEMSALPPCHYSYNLVADPIKKELHLLVVMRSWDTFLSFNIAIAGMWLAVFAKLAGYTPRIASVVAADAHVYGSHTSQVELLLSRDHFQQPKLHLGDSIQALTDVSQIRGAFERIQPEDIQLIDYVSHPAIPAPMAS